MNYHAPTDQFTMHPADMKRAASLLRYAIRHIRNGANLDPTGYKNQARETDWAEFSEDAILDAAKALGIDLGADRPGKLDVSKDEG